MSERRCRWGILGTAGIARKNWHAILNSQNATLVAVASRTRDRAAEFIRECQTQFPLAPAPDAVGSYEELLARTDIDAIYIPLPTGLRKEWVLRAAAAGKHVLAEKPCGIDTRDVEQMVNACREKHVLFMDGVMFMHSARLAQLRAVLNNPSYIGDIKRISSAFSFCAPDAFLQDNIRVHSSLEPHGCLGDLGWYTIRMTLWILNYMMPEKVSGRLLSRIQATGSQFPTPTEFSAELFFPGGVSANFYCTFLAEHQQWVRISGSRGYIALDDFVLPRYGNEVEFQVVNNRFAQDGCVFTMEEYAQRFATSEFGNNAKNSQETNLFRNFSQLVLDKHIDPHWGEIAIQTQRVMDACYQSAQRGGEFVSP